jgi:hypothetical protein
MRMPAIFIFLTVILSQLGHLHADSLMGPTDAANLAFLSHGFQCAPVSPSAGLTCIGRITGYPNEVAVIVPPSYQATQQVDLVLHLHGHNLSNDPLSVMLAKYRPEALFAQTGRNSILVVPGSRGKCLEFQQFLADGPHFQNFIDQLAVLIQGASLSKTAEVHSIALSGHSGAYRSLATIISNGVYADQIQELYLLDSAYGKPLELARFALTPGHRFWSAYHPDDPDQYKTHRAIRKAWDAAGVEYGEFESGTVTERDLRRYQVGIVVSDVDHDKTMTQYFPILLSVKVRR